MAIQQQVSDHVHHSSPQQKSGVQILTPKMPTTSTHATYSSAHIYFRASEKLQQCVHDTNDDDTATRKRSRRNKNHSGSFSDVSSMSSSIDNCDHSTMSSKSSCSSNSSIGSASCATRSITTPTRISKPSRRRCRGRGKNKTKQQLVVETLSVEEQAQYVALDCEMVGVGMYGQASAVARVTLVGWNGEVIMDELIKPEQPVTDYRTFVSGITEQDLFGEHATNIINLAECQAMVRSQIEGKILIGHALKNDLCALGVRHPWQMTRDTAKYEPFMQVRFDDGVLWPRKLRDLVHEKLNHHKMAKDFQEPGQAHSSYDDALAALELYKVVRSKWEKVMAYKISKTLEIQQHQAASSPSCAAKPVVVAMAAPTNPKSFAAALLAAC
jgi:RNA exonuclease 4